MKAKEDIKYFTHHKDSIFAGMQVRENPDDWMFMYSENGRDYFKHCDYRNYIPYPQYGIAETI